VPAEATHNGHIYYVVLPEASQAQRLLTKLKSHDIGATTHYVPLHSAPAGRRFCRTAGDMAVTDNVASCLLRLPLHAMIEDGEIDRVVEVISAHLAPTYRASA
jgi:dTDP-4-amino-4,6-dideoxygalactose transaminase